MNHIVYISSLLLLLVFSCSAEERTGDLLIENINVIHVENGNIEHSVNVLIQEDTIVSIESMDAKINYQIDTTIDGSGQYLIPGFWDTHVHTWWVYEEFSPLLLANGVVGVREMNGDLPAINQIKSSLDAAEIIGPEIVSAGPIIDGDPPSRDDYQVASTPEEGRALVRAQKQAGADFIKVYFNLAEEVYLAIADECREQDLPLAGHLPNKVPLATAVAAGHQTFDHLYNVLATIAEQEGLDRIEESRSGRFVGAAFYERFDHIIATYDANRVDELIEAYSREKAVYLCPTFTVHKGFQRDLDPNYLGDDRLQYMPESFVSGWLSGKNEPISVADQKMLDAELAWYQLMIQLIKPLADSGVQFLTGTDYPGPFVIPGWSLHEEMQIFVQEAGLTELQALQAATINAAKYLQLEDHYGTIATGKQASLLILANNPLDAIEHTESITGMLLDGRYYSKEELMKKVEIVTASESLPAGGHSGHCH
ncbi:MAG: amidohydrolase family protein [Bacteroidota bacterium]